MIIFYWSLSLCRLLVLSLETYLIILSSDVRIFANIDVIDVNNASYCEQDSFFILSTFEMINSIESFNVFASTLLELNETNRYLVICKLLL